MKELEKYTACDVGPLSFSPAKDTENQTEYSNVTDDEKISDALLKLNVPNAGFLCDIREQHLERKKTPPANTSLVRFFNIIIIYLHKVAAVPRTSSGINVSLATTVLFAPSTSTEPPCSLPAGTHYADFITPRRTVVVSQPAGQRCAVVGGIVAERMYQLGARAIVVAGRVRDVEGFGEREDLMVRSDSLLARRRGGEAAQFNSNV